MQAAACLARAGYRCEGCGTPQAELKALCPACHISQQGDRYCWQVGDLTGIATDVLDAIGSALHCLVMERLEEQEEVRA